MKNLRSVKARRGTRHWDWGEDFDPAREKKALDPAKVFDLEREQEAFSNTVLPSVVNVYESFGEGTAESLGVAFNLRDPVVAQDIIERDNRLRGTVDTTWFAVQEAIIDGEAAGEGIDGIAKRIGAVFDQAKGYRARVIARTETIGASNAASLYAADSSGVVGKKTWLAASDPRTRPSHVSADGQTVDIKKAFQVGTSKMQHPGDPNGGARETVNCRCSMVFERLPEAEIPVEFEDEGGTVLDVRRRRVEDAVRRGKGDGFDTSERYVGTKGPGSYTRERWLQQEDILDELWDAAEDVPNDGEALFSGGLGGAGKGTVLRSADAGVDTSRYLTIDPDAIKEAMARRGMIPTIEGFEDLSPMELSALIHEESSHIAARLAARAAAEKKNVIFDITMSTKPSVVKRLDLLRHAGYEKIEGIFVDIPVETSVERALARWERGLADYLKGKGEGGRYVPPEIIRAQADEVWGSINRSVFEDVKDQFSGWRLFDNSGDAPRLIASKADDLAPPVRLTPSGVPLTEEMPVGLSRSEQTDWFTAKWGKIDFERVRYDRVTDDYITTHELIDRVIDFPDIPGLEAYENLLRTLDRQFTHRPDVANSIRRVGTIKALGIRAGARTQGIASRGDYLALRGEFLATMETATKNAVTQKSSGWWSTGDPFGILVHEFGHHVHYNLERILGLDPFDRKGVRDFLNPILREVSGLPRASVSSGQGLQWLRYNLSQYGTTNPYEVFAEAWAEYQTMGDAARPFAKAVGEAVDAALDARLASAG